MPIKPLTVPIWPDAGEILGVSRSLAYEMARTGQLPTIAAGRRRLVPIARLRVLLGLPAEGDLPKRRDREGNER